MPAWGNTDALADKPHFPRERQVRVVATLTTANNTNIGNTVLTFTGTSTSASRGLVAGQSVYITAQGNSSNVSTTGETSFFVSNNTIRSVNANTAVLVNGVMGNVPAGTSIDIGDIIVYATNTNGVANTVANVFSDTILVTAGRLANTQGTTYGGGSTVANTKLGSVNTGWNLIQRKINNDGTVRFLKETLVAMSSPVASNVSSANTSANAIFGGL